MKLKELLESKTGYYFIQAGINRHPKQFSSELAAVRAGNKLFDEYRIQTLQVKYKEPGKKAQTVKTLNLNESLGSARGMASLASTKREMADATHNMHVLGMLDKKLKPEEITDDQARKFIKKMEAVDERIPEFKNGKPNDSDEVAAEYEEARDKVIARILKGK